MTESFQFIEFAPFVTAIVSFITGLFIPKFNFWISNEKEFSKKLNFAKNKIIGKYSSNSKQLIEKTLDAGVESSNDDIYTIHSEESLKTSIEAYNVCRLGDEGKNIYVFFLITALLSPIGFGLSFYANIKAVVLILLVIMFIIQIIVLLRLYWIERFLNKYEDAF